MKKRTISEAMVVDVVKLKWKRIHMFRGSSKYHVTGRLTLALDDTTHVKLYIAVTPKGLKLDNWRDGDRNTVKIRKKELWVLQDAWDIRVSESELLRLMHKATYVGMYDE
jgi:hypothetical protein